MTQYGKYPEAFYRVAIKALIRDATGNVLLVKEDSTEWDLPGGGMDHGESVDVAMARELHEEIGYEGGLTMEYAGMVPLYVQRMDACMVLIVFSVTLLDEYKPIAGESSSEVAYINPDVFMGSSSRSGKLIYKFARDRSLPIPFEP